MHGMIHRAARCMVIDQVGEEAWNRAMALAGLLDEDFISTRIYPDEKMGSLIGAIAEVRSVSPERVLEQFGEYFVEFAYSSRYRRILSFTGDSLLAVLENLDRMHAEVGRAMPGVRLPSFSVIEAGPDAIRLVYISSRQDMETFVVGLLRGLMKHFGVIGAVNPLKGEIDDANFVITMV